MNRRDFLSVVAAGVLTPPAPAAAQGANGWQAGAATVDITPEQSLWMAGYARRKQASQGVSHPLHAKALALRAPGRPPAILVTVDLLGLTARTTDRVTGALERRHQVRRADVLFNASHTHSGPVVDDQLAVAYDLDAAQWSAIQAYATALGDKLIALVGTALSRLAPARLSYGTDTAPFAANRRVKFSPDGPVDRTVPVLHVQRTDGATQAIVFGYACHNTTLSDAFVQFHGDYAGVARVALERRHPGATALFVAGCGADANPTPRGTLEHVETHGAALADAVDRALRATTPVAPRLRTAFGAVDLPFAAGAQRERWRKQLPVEAVYLERYDRLMASVVARDGRLPAAQRAPVHVWDFGPDLSLVALPGEVVIDYALRLARENPKRRMWVAGYTDDVFGYVPSQRVLREGGYEGGDAMVYYGRPAPFTDAVEELLIGQVRRLMEGS